VTFKLWSEQYESETNSERSVKVINNSAQLPIICIFVSPETGSQETDNK